MDRPLFFSVKSIKMSTSPYIFNVTRGNNFSLYLNAKNSDSSFINLNGYSATGIVKYQFSSTGTLIDLKPYIDPSYTSGLIIISGNVGSNVPIGQFPYDVSVYTGNYYFQVLYGYINVKPTTSF